VSALARALAMVDSANGISAELDVRKFLFVPVNLTVSIDRAPLGEWVGMSAKTRLASEGVGTTHARLFDETGYLGESLQTLFVEPR
jgi:acyl-CoA thioesterase